MSISACQAADAAATNVGMGQLAVRRPPGLLTSILGSCLGVALYHPRLKLAGLAHVVLPDSGGRSGTPGKFADTAIPQLVEALAAEGALVAGLVAKIAGGASMFNTSGPIQIGEANIQAVLQLLRAANVHVAGSHVGGNQGRRVTVDPATGQMTVEIVGAAPVVL